jgi:transcriptional regulator with XRE-family HTH domain
MGIEKSSLGAAIRQVRLARGMTQVELAKASGLSEGGKSIALIEQGRRSVSMDTLNSLAEALAIPSGCLAILGSTGGAKNKAANELLESLQMLISAVLLAQSTSEDEPPKRTAERRKVASAPL